MKKGLAYLVGLLFLFVSCSQRPKDVMDTDKMGEMLAAVHKTDILIKNSYVPSYEDKKAYYRWTFEKHNTTKEDFDRSLKWYAGNPKKLQKCYDVALEIIDAEQADVRRYKYHPEDLHPKDSIQVLNLWLADSNLVYSPYLSTDSTIRFTFNNTAILKQLDSVEWVFRMRVYDTLINENPVALMIHYDNKSCDTLSCNVPCDSTYMNYRFWKWLPDSINATQLDFIFQVGDSLNIQSVAIDSIQAKGWYDRVNHPITDGILLKHNTLYNKE